MSEYPMRTEWSKTKIRSISISWIQVNYVTTIHIVMVVIIFCIRAIAKVAATPSFFITAAIARIVWGARILETSSIVF